MRRGWQLGSLISLCALSGCMQAAQTYALKAQPGGIGHQSVVGSVSVERIEGGQRLVVLQLAQLPPPERFSPGLHEYVVWLKDPQGAEIKVGTLDYDRTHQSGNLLATTDLPRFTVRVTGERDGDAREPGSMLLAEHAVPN